MGQRSTALKARRGGAMPPMKWVTALYDTGCHSALLGQDGQDRTWKKHEKKIMIFALYQSNKPTKIRADKKQVTLFMPFEMAIEGGLVDGQPRVISTLDHDYGTVKNDAGYPFYIEISVPKGVVDPAKCKAKIYAQTPVRTRWYLLELLQYMMDEFYQEGGTMPPEEEDAHKLMTESVREILHETKLAEVAIKLFSSFSVIAATWGADSYYPKVADRKIFFAYIRGIRDALHLDE